MHKIYFMCKSSIRYIHVEASLINFVFLIVHLTWEERLETYYNSMGRLNVALETSAHVCTHSCIVVSFVALNNHFNLFFSFYHFLPCWVSWMVPQPVVQDLNRTFFIRVAVELIKDIFGYPELQSKLVPLTSDVTFEFL